MRASYKAVKSQVPEMALRVLWTGGESVTVGRMLLAGALVWAAYSVIALLVTGVVIDESVIPVQIMTGAVQYPPGHPHQIYYLHAYNLFYYLGAGVWSIKPDPLLISAFRNVLFLLLSTFVPFAFAVLLTQRPLWGHVAATLTTTETIVPFRGVYQLWVFPDGYSSGHLGLHIALLTVALLIARSWKAGGVMLGLLPALHPVMPLIVWPWSAIYFLREKVWRRSKHRTWLVSVTSLGLVISVILAVLLFTNSTNASVASAPYDQIQANGEVIHRQFVSTTDVHRQLPPLRSFGYLLGPTAFFAIGALLWRNTKQLTTGSPGAGLRSSSAILVLGGIIGIYIYGSWLLQFVNGSLPAPIEASMPFRFSNMYALLLLPFTVAAFAAAYEALNEKLQPLAIAMLTGLVLITGIDLIFNRVGQGANYPVFVAWGLLFGLQIWAWKQHRNRLFEILIAIALVGGTLHFLFQIKLELVFWGSFVTALAVLAAGATLLRRVNLNWQRWNSLLAVVLIAGCVVTSAAAIPGRKIDRRGWRRERADMISPFDRELNSWLASNARPNEMILSPVFPRSDLQPKTGHPVLMELETLWLMTYMPTLSSTIGVMARDLYGIDYSDREKLNPMLTDGSAKLHSDVVMEVWEKRSRNEWQSLSRKYGFRLVVSESKRSLDLLVGLRGPNWTLWVIPEETLADKR